MEYFSESKRVFALCIYNTLAVFGYALTPIVAKLVNNRRSIHIWAGLLSVPAIPIAYFLIPESVRWLVSNNRASKAEKIVQVLEY